ncbi:MAG: serine protease Do [Planctomycetota bacterium]|jgi:serine protease Do
MRAQLLHLSGPLRGRTITYPQRLVRIGSSATCEARMVSKVVSDHHAEIEWVKEQCQFHLRAIESSVFVNGNEVEEVILKDGDLLEVGAGGPMARFRIYVPIGAACKPVRRMLTDAREVAQYSGRATATRMLTKDLLTQATMTLKVGFPLALFAALVLSGWLGGWLSSRPAQVQKLMTADTVMKAEIEAMRVEYQAELKRLSQANDVIRRVQKEWTRGVCLIHGIYRLRKPDGSLLLDFTSQPMEVEYTGSGFLVSKEGHIVTNRHVALPWTEDSGHMKMMDAGSKPVFTRLTVTFPGKMPIDVAQTTIRRRDDELDVAVIQITSEQAKGIPVLPLRQDGTDGQDERAIVVGYPTGLAALLARASSDTLDELRRTAATTADAIQQLAAANQIKPVITFGVISNSEEHVIAYDAGTTSGGSGGPVFSDKGDVIAVNFAIQRNFAGNNLGVPIRHALALLKK